ncbi:hypothetical protein [Aneurinibacillus aneurinilyticus]|uniref:Uncharacterized protein n=1 Tax=Aneurinibacillus aneurinilyticus ATCC 12856 TaxID=649747 RepID=U1YKA1_ANEAE|nr:hypothetical protein [Aneurinibacillus aneurinilyticus]ERI11216.1 hypothetical protein HMPREF0083_00627 [Aneurinibacillus aneurinilyticus ATCC 12856]MED0705072.1 hypothetical protein [Aneurinibacillus aneurinilyticus]MED0721873.1 hypothetical protein [Aneurinibacillus aneurinilyticus]MED0731564.1 hypothetical protein [Aneurinibacillus aneurinilyticus]MED0741648.1 hypothetical protein [Aneurinibacillus aneurinilyticus]
MMISPEGYYEEYLKGKTEEQILTVIRGLKQEIGRLKNTMESPDYGIVPIVHPSKETRLHWTREYLEGAKQAYAEAGGTYTLSKSEEKTADFDANMGAICKINFSIDGFFGGYRSYVIELSDELKAYTKLWEDKEPLFLLDDANKKPFTKDTFIAALKDLHIGEWRRRYSTKRFGYMVCDGTQWELEFEYNNGHKSVRFDGDNSYPYNFDKFQMLFGIDDTEEGKDE